MSDNLRIAELVEEALATGRTPEEVCVNDPQLLHAVREQWQSCRQLDAQLDQLFPTPDDGQKANDDDSRGDQLR